MICFIIGRISEATDLVKPMVVAGGSHTVALKSDGTVWTYGSNSSGQLGDDTTIWRTTPVQVSNLTDITVIDAGFLHTIALKSDMTVQTWGNNNYWQLGDQVFANKTQPVQVLNLNLGSYVENSISPLSARYCYTVVKKKDNTLWSYGLNDKGQLGDGTTILKATPTQVDNGSIWKQLSASYKHTIALKEDGSLWSWGCNSFGQLGNGTYSNKCYPICVMSADVFYIS